MKPYVGVILWAALAILTLIPAPASKPSLLGYYAHCTFAPVSTLICLALAAITYQGVRKKLQGQ